MAGNEGPPRPQQTRGEAQKLARKTGKRVKVLGLTTQTEQTWANPDGSWTTEVATGPERVKGADGSWHAIDTRLVERRGALAPAHAATDLSLSGGGDSTFASLSKDGKKLAWRWPGKLPEPTVQGDTATYRDVVPGGDLVVTALSTGFSHSIVLRRRPGGRMRFTIPVTTDGASLTKTPGGGLSIRDKDGDEVVGAPGPLMWDSTENKVGDPQHVAPVDVSVGQSAAAGPAFTLAPDSGFLSDPETVYPVTIDPSFTKWTNGDVWVQNAGYTTGQVSSPELRAGTYDGGAHKARSFMHFDTTTWDNTKILSAKLILRNFYSGSCKGATILAKRIQSPWNGNTLTWANKPGGGDVYEASYSPAHGYTSSCGAANATWNVKDMVQDWADGDFDNNGIMLRASDETSIYTWRKYRSANYSSSSLRPRIVVDYNSYPNKPTSLSTSPSVPCATGSSRPDMSSSAPTLKATVSDPDNGTVYGKFEVYNTGDSSAPIVSGTSAAVSSNNVASWKIPTGKLVPGRNYSWKVRAHDLSLYSSYSVWCEFTVQLPTPNLDPPTTLHATGAELSWSPYVNPNDTITEYQVHRSTTPDFTVSSGTRLTTLPTSARSWTDGTATPTPADAPGDTGSTYYYRLAVKTAGGALVSSPTQAAQLPKAGGTTKIFGTTSPSTDTTLSSSQPTTNLDSLGGQSALQVGNSNSSYGSERAVLDFGDLTSIPAGSRVLSAKLGLWATANSGTGASFAAHALTGGFDEASATWARADSTRTWDQPGGDFDTPALGTPVSVTGTGAWQNLDVGDAVKDWLTSPESNHGLLVKATDEATPSQYVTFASSESTTATQRPRLVVTYLTKTTENTYYAPYTPQLMSPNDDETVTISVTNTTNQTWNTADWILSYHWMTPNGDEHSSPPDSQAAAENRALPQDVSPGETVEFAATVHPPVNDQSGVRSDWLLAWDMRNKTTGQWLSEIDTDLQPLAQTVTVDKPPAEKLGLEDYYQYVGQATGAGSTLLVNQYYGNSIWSYNAFTNPSRGVNTFARMTYNSNDKSDTPLGWGWSLSTSTLNQLGTPLGFHPAGQQIPDEVKLVDGDGTSHVFRYDDASGEYQHPDGVHLFLQQTGSNEPDRAWVMTRPDGTKFYFDEAGYHTSTMDKNGNTLTFTYNPVDNNSENAPKQLVSITDGADRTTLVLDYYEKDQDYSYIDTDGTNPYGTKVAATNKLTDPDIIGQVESMVDVSGRKITFTYSEEGVLGEMVDGAGAGGGLEKRFRFGYAPDETNTHTALISVEDPRDKSSTLTYHAPPGSDAEVHWRTKTITNRSGDTTGFGYTDPDANSGALMHSTVTDPKNRATKYEMDAFGRPTKITNAQSKNTRLNWDNDNNVILLEEPPASAGEPAAVTTWTYDKLTGYPLTITDPEANRGGVDPDNPHVELTYQKSLTGHVANLATKTSALGSTTADPTDYQWAFGYDAKGNLTSVTDPEGVATAEAGDYETSHTYDPSTGDLSTVTDANGNTTRYDNYDANGYPRTITDAKEHSTIVEYDERGNVTSVTDAKTNTSSYEYDVFGRLGQTEEPKSATDRIYTPAPKYDGNDNVEKAYAPYINTQPANLAVWENTYDAMDRLENAFAPKDTAGGDQRKTSYTYDKVGNLKTVTEPEGNLTAPDPNNPDDPARDDFETTYDYDSLDQLEWVTNATGDQIRYTYDDAGNLSTVSDPKKVVSPADDFTTKYLYDLNHRVTKVIDAAGKSVEHVYDKDGRVTDVIDQKTQQTTKHYDMRGLVTKVTVPHTPTENRSTEYTYDEVGNRTRSISPRGLATADTVDPEDFTTTWTYDELNRVKERLLPKGTGDTGDPEKYSYEYDEVGNLMTVSAPPSGTSSVRANTTYSHFADGLLQQSTDPWDITTSYDYNAMGLQTSRAVSAAGETDAARTMSWGYFPDGKLASRADSGIPVGRHVVLVDNSDEQNVSRTNPAEWDSVSDPDKSTYQGYDYEIHLGSTGSVFTWKPVIPAAGTYQVYARNGAEATATNASYTVHHSGGQTTASPVDQTVEVGKWRSLGSYTFAKGTGHKITLSDQANGTVGADAVKLVRVPTQAERDTAQGKDFTYLYDTNANLTTITDNTAQPGAPTPDTGVYDVRYTELNQVQEVAELPTEGALASKTTSYSYDINGNIKTLATDLAGSTNADQYSTYLYGDIPDLDIVEPRDLLSQVRVGTSEGDANPKVTTFTYDPLGLRKTQVKNNGNTVAYDYYSDRLLKQTVETKDDIAETVVSQHDLTYTPNGHRETDTTRLMNANNNNAYLDFVRHYTYDPQDRIEKVEKKNQADTVLETELYTHDPAGNVTEQTLDDVHTVFTYDRNRLLKAEATPVGGGTPTNLNYNYDPTGRLDTVIADDTARTVVEAYEYDGFDHISKHTKNPGTGAVTTTYTYDPLDRTSSRTKNAGTPSAKTTDFTYLGLTETLIGENDDSTGQLTKTYQYTPWGERLSQVKHNTNGTTEDSYYGYNPHTDVETLTKADGNTRATYGYTAYGKPDDEATTGVDKPDANNPDKEPYNPYRYTGKRWDETTGNLDMGFRDYSPGLNRFLTRDSYNGALNDLNLATNPWTSNSYALAAGNPITGVELDGHMPDWNEGGGTQPGTSTVQGYWQYKHQPNPNVPADSESVRAAIDRLPEREEAPAYIEVPFAVTFSLTGVGAFVGAWEAAYDATHNAKKGDYRAAAISATGVLPFKRLPKITSKGGGLFEEFGVRPGRGLNLSTPSAGDRSYITYGFADSDGAVAYVGRASGVGTPEQVLASRLAKGHHVFDSNPDLNPFIVDVQGSLAASRGAEEFFIQGFREQGAQLLNIDPAVGFSTSARGAKSVDYIDAFFADLLGRG